MRKTFTPVLRVVFLISLIVAVTVGGMFVTGLRVTQSYASDFLPGPANFVEILDTHEREVFTSRVLELSVLVVDGVTWDGKQADAVNRAASKTLTGATYWLDKVPGNGAQGSRTVLGNLDEADNFPHFGDLNSMAAITEAFMAAETSVVASAVGEWVGTREATPLVTYALANDDFFVGPELRSWRHRVLQYTGENITGSSGGLAQALAAADLNMRGALTAGRTVSATGSIVVSISASQHPGIAVGLVGGIRAKADAAAAAGADVFLFPGWVCGMEGYERELCGEFDLARPDGGTMRAVPVNTVAQALNYLDPSIPADAELVTVGAEPVTTVEFPTVPQSAVPLG